MPAAADQQIGTLPSWSPLIASIGRLVSWPAGHRADADLRAPAAGELILLDSLIDAPLIATPVSRRPAARTGSHADALSRGHLQRFQALDGAGRYPDETYRVVHL